MRQKGWLRPGAPDVVFAIVLAMGLVGGRTGFLDDPGTYWHIELGRQITETGAVPRADQFTYTRPHAPWVDQSWAFDVLVAAIYDHWGWSGAVVATALALAWLYGALARGLCRDGVMPLVAAVVAVLAAGIGSIHFLTRPHLFTFAFVLWMLRACKAYHERGGQSLFFVPLVMAVWANVHGGFLAGPVILATAAAGHAISGPYGAERMRRLKGFAGAFALSLLAPLANPYGFDLYRHVCGLLFGSGVTKLIDEYQPIPFGHLDAMVVEWFVLAFIGLPCFSRKRLSRYEILHILVWLHLALASVRQAPLFALAAASGLAWLLDGLLTPPARGEPPEPPRGWSAWPVVASLVLAVSVPAGVTWGKLNPARWPIDALPVLNRQAPEARLFHEQDWGGMIEAECRPRRATFLDDRFELFGKQAILDYIEALKGGPGWDELDARDRFDLVWVRSDCGLAKRLSADPAWQRLFRDKVSALFARRR